MKKGDATHALCVQIAQAGLPEPDLEYLFCPVVDGKHVRRFRFDMAWPKQLVALEIEGSIFTGGRHGGRGSAAGDLEKRSIAACLGWRVIPVDTVRATNGTAMRYLRAALADGPLPL